MSTLYSGKPGAITTEAVLSVTGASNTNPITITVSGSLPADFYLVGTGGTPAAPLVDITGVTGNTAANGVNVATPTGASTFTIPVSGVGGGAYAGGGICQPLYLKSEFTVPSDGDGATEASIDSLVKAAGDRSQFLASRTGVAKLAGRVAYSFTDATGLETAWAAASVTAVASTWYPLALILGRVLNVTGISEFGCLSAVSVQPPFRISGLAGVHDAVHVSLQTDSTAPGGATPVRFGLFYAVVAPGAAAPAFATYNPVAGCSRYTLGTGGAGIAPVTLEGWIPNGPPGDLLIQPAVFSLAVTGAVTWALAGDSVFTVEVWRQTDMPQ
jgi:hypothetical protein